MKDIKKKIKELVTELNKYNYEYYILDNPSISDEEYDKKIRILKQLENKYPQYILQESPNLNVGGYASEKFIKIRHKYPMLSLNNTFSKEGIKNFCDKIKKINKDAEYICELKIDGLAISLIYENGKLLKAATRGNGIIGEDVTENVYEITDIPKNIELKEKLEFRGEVYITKSQFKKLNEERIKNKEDVFANSRNIASGTIRTLDSSVTKNRKLNSFIYSTTPEVFESLKINEQYQFLKCLKKLNFSVEKNYKLCRSIEDIYNYIDYWTENKNMLNYEIDGIVIKVNNINLYYILGYTSKDPKWALAYKFPASTAETKVKKIFLTVGRTGKITPNAILEPIKLSGSIIKKITLHNMKIIFDNDIRENDYILIQKSGDVIPNFLKVLKNKRESSSIKYEFNKKCPSCGQTLIKKERESIDYYCINNKCTEKIINELAHFTSRKGMNIIGLGKKTLYNLYKNNILLSIIDIYNLNKKKLLNIPRMGDKTIDKLLFEINESKKNNADKLLFSLGIDNVGENIAKILLTNKRDIDKLINISYEEILKIDDIGSKTAKNIEKWFSNVDNINLIKDLKMKGINTEYKNINGKLYDKKIVISGKFKNYSRNRLIDILGEQGAIVSNTINKKIDLLLIGDSYGSKFQKAKELSVDIFSIKEFNKQFSMNLKE